MISTDQTGFVKGRSITTNLTNIQMAIDQTNTSNSTGLICAVDYKKAFNTIRWDIIHRALELFGFGELICSAVKLLFTDIKTSFQLRVFFRLFQSLTWHQAGVLLLTQPLHHSCRALGDSSKKINDHPRNKSGRQRRMTLPFSWTASTLWTLSYSYSTGMQQCRVWTSTTTNPIFSCWATTSTHQSNSRH